MLALKFHLELAVEDDEPARFIKFIDGTIYLYVNGERKVKAGNFSVIIMDVVAAVNERESVFDVFDFSSKTIDYFSLYAPGLEFKPKVLKALGGGDRWEPGMLILDRLEVLPGFRRQAVGLRVLRWLRIQFSMGCGVVVMKPFPLQFEGGTPEENKGKPDFVRLRLDLFDTDFHRARRKLRDYYGRAGFVVVAGTSYMVADPMRQAPTLEEMGIDRWASIRITRG